MLPDPGAAYLITTIPEPPLLPLKLFPHRLPPPPPVFAVPAVAVFELTGKSPRPPPPAIGIEVVPPPPPDALVTDVPVIDEADPAPPLLVGQHLR
jgi:hypothetical protein